MRSLRPVIRFAWPALLMLAIPGRSQAQDSGKPAKPATAQQQADDSVYLAKQLANPLADLVSVPFQGNWDSSMGPNEPVTNRGRTAIPGKGTRFVLDIRPVIPFSLSEKWNIITRVSLPLVSQPAVITTAAPTFGVGDVLASAYLTRREPGKFFWGVGPALSLPSTADVFLGSGKWAAGPSGIILKQKGSYTYGAIWNQIWSFAGNPDRDDVSRMQLQPFFAYTTDKAWTFGVDYELTANWKAAEGEKLMAPLVFQASKIAYLGEYPVSFFVGAGPYVGKPETGPTWKLRAGIAVILER